MEQKNDFFLTTCLFERFHSNTKKLFCKSFSNEFLRRFFYYVATKSKVVDQRVVLRKDN